MLLQHINPILHTAVAHAHMPRRALRLVVAGNALPAQRLLLARSQRQSRRHRRRHLRSATQSRSLPARMHRIRQQNNVSPRRRIDPHRCSRQPRMPKPPTGSRIPAVRRKRRINVPPKPPQHRSPRRLLRPRHLLDRQRRQNPVASIQQSLRKFRQIVPGRKQPGMPRHAAHPPRRRIMHHPPQHVLILVILRRRNLQAATPPEAQTASASSSAAQKYAAAAYSSSVSPDTRSTSAPSTIKFMSL